MTAHDFIEYCKTSTRPERNYAAVTFLIFILLMVVIVLSIFLHH